MAATDLNANLDMAGLFSLKGRAALITGASRGIGRHAAQLFSNAGAVVALAGRDTAKLAELAQYLQSLGRDAVHVHLDLENQESISAAFDEATQLLGRPLDLLLNNAGVLQLGRFLDQAPEEMAKVLDINLKGAFLVAQQGARRMAASGGGSIINVASTSGLRAGGQTASYGASKAGVIQMTEIAALELAGKGIRVNAIAPGNVRTGMYDAIQGHGLEESISKRIPMGRFGMASELDGALLLLASDAGSYITGVTIPVDGGQVLSWM